MSGNAEVRLGRDETGHDVIVDFMAPWHMFVQGMSRSGKSVDVYLLLAPLAARDDTIVVGVDPTGILLSPWRAASGDKYRYLGAADMRAAADALAAICREMDDRIVALMDAGLDKLDTFTSQTPLLVVVLEEYPGTLSLAEVYDSAEGLKPAERTATSIKRSVRRLVQEGAKVGVRVVMIAQRADASIVGGTERSNFGLRISMRVDNNDAVRMLHPSATDDLCEAVQLAQPGQGVYELPGHRLTRFKADFCTYQQYTQFVRRQVQAGR